MTPRYFAALCRRRKEQRRHDDYMLAQVAAAIINFGGRGAKRWFQPRDLMPGEKQSAERRVSKQAIADQVRAAFRGYMERSDG